MPFHRPASIRSVPARLIEDPTAVQELEDVHDTPRRLLSAAPAGFGVGWIDQVLPSQRSAKLASAPAGIGVRCTVQAEAATRPGAASHSAPTKKLRNERLVGGALAGKPT